MNKRVILIISVLAFVAAGFVCYLCNNKKNYKKMTQDTEQQNQKYIVMFGISGDFLYDGKTVITKSPAFDEKETLQKLALYNEYNSTKYSMDDVKDAYEMFCSGSEDYDLLDNICSFIEQYKNRIGKLYDNYIFQIISAKDALYPAKDILDLTITEYDECCIKGAELMKNYIEEKGISVSLESEE